MILFISFSKVSASLSVVLVIKLMVDCLMDAMGSWV